MFVFINNHQVNRDETNRFTCSSVNDLGGETRDLEHFPYTS